MKFKVAFYLYRTKAGLTVQQVAQSCGVTEDVVKAWESGAAVPKLSFLPVVAAVLGCDMKELILDKRARFRRKSGDGELLLALAQNLERIAETLKEIVRRPAEEPAPKPEK